MLGRHCRCNDAMARLLGATWPVVRMPRSGRQRYSTHERSWPPSELVVKAHYSAWNSGMNGMSVVPMSRPICESSVVTCPRWCV